MGDKATLEKARRELEELYLGVPDDSVNLTFQDLADVKQLHEKKRTSQMDPISETNPKREEPSVPLTKFTSFHTSRSDGLEQPPTPTHHHYHHGNNDGNHHHHQHHHMGGDNGAQGGHRYTHHHRSDHHGSPYSPRRDFGFGHADDVSVMSTVSVNTIQERGGRHRPGIPHSKICTICSVYIYIFGHRCLVCGRVYCRTCVSVGMGEMPEGRKCVECLGRRFSQRYIQRAGHVGCCMRYPSTVKQQELKWAEKGPRRSGDRGYGRSTVMSSRSRSPITPRTPTRAHATSSPPSFVMNSPYSTHSPTNHPIPF